MVEFQRLLWLHSPILDRQALLQLLQMNSALGSMGAGAGAPLAPAGSRRQQDKHNILSIFIFTYFIVLIAHERPKSF